MKDDKICTMVSSMGLRWGSDTGTQMAVVEHCTGRKNLQKEGKINPGIHPTILYVILFSQLLIKLIGVREEHEMNNNHNSDQ